MVYLVPCFMWTKSSIVLLLSIIRFMISLLNLKLEREDINDLDLLEKKIFSCLEKDVFYYGNIIIITIPKRSNSFFTMFYGNKIEKYIFPYKNDINESKHFLKNAYNIISLAVYRYSQNEEFDIYLEFTKIS